MLITAFGDKNVIHEDNKVYERKLITGRKTTDSKCKGYCSYGEHPGYLDDGLILEHNCIANMCNYFMTKLPENEDTNAGEMARQLNLLQDKHNSERDTLYLMCNSATDHLEGLKITKVFRQNNEWLIKYVAICSVDECEIRKSLTKVVPGKFRIEQEEYDFEVACKIVYGDN